MDLVGLCNAALGLLGATPISSLGEATTTGELVTRFLPLARDVVLEARDWSFASKRFSLAADGAPPAYGYPYRYQLHSEVIRVLEAGDGTPSSDYRWELEGRFILIALAGPLKVRATVRLEDPALWPPGFQDAVVLRLAIYLCDAITENRSLQADLFQLYRRSLQEAGARDGQQGNTQRQRPSGIAQRRW